MAAKLFLGKDEMECRHCFLSLVYKGMCQHSPHIRPDEWLTHCRHEKQFVVQVCRKLRQEQISTEIINRLSAAATADGNEGWPQGVVIFERTNAVAGKPAQIRDSQRIALQLSEGFFLIS